MHAPGFVFQLSTGKMFLFVSNVAVHILAKKCVLFNRYVAEIVNCCCYLLFIIKEPYSEMAIFCELDH